MFSVRLFVYFCVRLRDTFVWMFFADALGSLEGVEGVGEVHVGIGLIHQLIQRHNSIHHPHVSVVAFGPFNVLQKGRSKYLLFVHHVNHLRLSTFFENSVWNQNKCLVSALCDEFTLGHIQYIKVIHTVFGLS